MSGRSRIFSIGCWPGWARDKQMSGQSREFTPFELEVIDVILWIFRGVKEDVLSLRAANRIMRASLRRIRAETIGSSVAALEGVETELDHAVPISVLVSMFHANPEITKNGVIDILTNLLVDVRITKHEHAVILQRKGLSCSMPLDWDGINPLARYQAAGISVTFASFSAVAPRSSDRPRLGLRGISRID